MKLIKKVNSNQTYYQLDFKIKKYPKGTIKNLFEADPIKLLDKYELAEDISDSIDKICISDANTHIERLIFPVFNVRNKETGEIFLTHRCNNIHGSHTFMIDGGDYNTIKSPEVYVRALRILNK